MIKEGQPITDRQIKGSLKDVGNRRGAEIEQKVAGILQRLHYVNAVIVTEKDQSDDREMRDLIVDIRGREPGNDPITVFVQCKASVRGEQHFVEELRKRLIREGLEKQISIKEWMLQNRVILLNGDFTSTRSGKNCRHLSDEEILESFETQLAEILKYKKPVVYTASGL